MTVKVVYIGKEEWNEKLPMSKKKTHFTKKCVGIKLYNCCLKVVINLIILHNNNYYFQSYIRKFSE